MGLKTKVLSLYVYGLYTYMHTHLFFVPTAPDAVLLNTLLHLGIAQEI